MTEEQRRIEAWHHYCDDFSTHLQNAKGVITLIGTGLSASSGISTYQRSGSTWREHLVRDLATRGRYGRTHRLFGRTIAIDRPKFWRHHLIPDILLLLDWLPQRKIAFQLLRMWMVGLHSIRNRCWLTSERPFPTSWSPLGFTCSNPWIDARFVLRQCPMRVSVRLLQRGSSVSRILRYRVF